MSDRKRPRYSILCIEKIIFEHPNFGPCPPANQLGGFGGDCNNFGHKATKHGNEGSVEKLGHAQNPKVQISAETFH